MNTDAIIPQKPKAPRGLVIGLALSMTLNLGMAGFIAGRLNHPKGMMMAGGAMQVLKIARQLPEQDQTLLRDSLKQHRDSFKKLMENNHAGRNAVKSALLAEPFDAAQLANALAENRKHSTATRDQIDTLLMEIAPKISSEGRKKLAALNQKNAGRDRMRRDMLEQRPEHR